MIGKRRLSPAWEILLGYSMVPKSAWYLLASSLAAVTWIALAWTHASAPSSSFNKQTEKLQSFPHRSGDEPVREDGQVSDALSDNGVNADASRAEVDQREQGYSAPLDRAGMRADPVEHASRKGVDGRIDIHTSAASDIPIDRAALVIVQRGEKRVQRPTGEQPVPEPADSTGASDVRQTDKSAHGGFHRFDWDDDSWLP